MSTPFSLTLPEVAAWQIKSPAGLSHAAPSCVARIPALQRGAVWKPSQVELLWDSLFRGFPIGAFVVCERLKGQGGKLGRHARGADGVDADEEFSHHLLDGQQRANAIALGFSDPFADHADQSVDASRRAALWLDLSPPKPTATTTRRFLFRVTTQPHPWGFSRADEAESLELRQIRSALKRANVANYHPSVSECWPYDASAPVPLAWLLDVAWERHTSHRGNGSGAPFLESLIGSLEKRRDAVTVHGVLPPRFGWIRQALDLLRAPGNEATRQVAEIGRRLASLWSIELIALTVPHEAITGSLEDDDIATATPNISDIEHLFQRLNSQGTRLSEDDLAFSMIKAYWPKVDALIETLADRLMPPARLATIAARAALSMLRNPTEPFPGPVGPAELRSRAFRNTGTGIEKGAPSPERNAIEEMFGSKSDLRDALLLIDAWLVGRDESSFMPAVLRTSVARSSPDVFAFLMWLALTEIRLQSVDIALSRAPEVRRDIIALTTTLHWFSSKKRDAVQAAFAHLRQARDGAPLSADHFVGVLRKASADRDAVWEPLSPQALSHLITVPQTPEELHGWDWWRLTRTEAGEEPKHREWQTLDFARQNTELLILAQRRFMINVFASYDPARTDLWAQRNRPWDFDHILPSAKFDVRNYPWGLKRWGRSIANLRVWPVERNRADGDRAPVKKLAGTDLDDSFLTEEERDIFQAAADNIRSEQHAFEFISMAKGRLIRIYGSWFDGFAVARLFMNPVARMLEPAEDVLRNSTETASFNREAV